MKRVCLIFVLIYSVAAGKCLAQFHTNTITTPNDILAFRVDGGPTDNPTILLRAGVTNILNIDTSPDHPVIIVTPQTFGFYSGASPQDVTNQPISLVTPSSGFPTNLWYVCSVHGFF